MSIFSKKEKNNSEKNTINRKHKSMNTLDKKKKRIGIRGKKNKNQQTPPSPEQNDVNTSKNNGEQKSPNTPLSENKRGKKDRSPQDDDLISELITEEDLITNQALSKGKEEEWRSSKRKAVNKKDMNGKPVYLEDTGEKIGIVHDAIYDNEHNHIGFKIKDSKSDSILSFALNQFYEDKGGLLFIPSWYSKGVKTIEKLEFKDNISPELTWLLEDKTISEDELYNIFVKYDDIVGQYIDEAMALRELLNSRLKILERERLTLKEQLMDLTEKRLIKDIDRRKFSEIVMKHRKKVNVLDVNIKKCKELIERLEQTSFGMLSRKQIFTDKLHDGQEDAPSHIEQNLNYFTDEYAQKENTNDHQLKNQYNELKEEYNTLREALEEKIQDPFESKYIDLKQHFIDLQDEYETLKQSVHNDSRDIYKGKYQTLKQSYKELQDDYGELKIAVEKLLQKNEQ